MEKPHTNNFSKWLCRYRISMFDMTKHDIDCDFLHRLALPRRCWGCFELDGSAYIHPTSDGFNVPCACFLETMMSQSQAFCDVRKKVFPIFLVRSDKEAQQCHMTRVKVLAINLFRGCGAKATL